MVIAFFLSLSLGMTQDFQSKVIYENDDRIDLYEVQDKSLLSLADSTVGFVKLNEMEELKDRWKLSTTSYSEEYRLCQEEKFHDQFIATACSGFLVAPNKVATAGHCLRDPMMDCFERKIVFGYALNMAGENVTELPKSEVYSCVRVISSTIEDMGNDYAIIEIDRPVTNHKPLKLNLTGNISNETPVFAIGHPSGLPMKISGGARVMGSDEISFTANLDTYSGSSGSPVFNAETHEVEGIVVRGEWDFVTKGTCNVSNVCKDNDFCTGETAIKVSVLKDFLKDSEVTTQAKATP